MSAPREGAPDGAGTAPDPAQGPAEVVDARGLRCPLPVIRLAARAKDLAGGTEVSVVSTDPAAQHDVPAWARMRGHETVAVTKVSGDWTITVRLRRSDT
ncbi:sulfurtransferase TusA family protein [Myceligenerans salitolerans]|uniref:Sulfurtransferase TusA family protein n=1 Tax=Myceligenerans salitolerans TaxID=1230528 RepID=A0ABS3IEH3_9MICO|nr:sulfurtransferase TusA family protein [Myceligenerans salitolerans]MBO0610843.1 sulfurtransferase TusA family protein [Myceligenerans salitolerans]